MRRLLIVAAILVATVNTMSTPATATDFMPHRQTTPAEVAFYSALTVPGDPVTAVERAEWSRVAVCEEGGWIGYAGPAYPDSLGISATNWFANGGTSDVQEDAQIKVAERIQTDPPDQGSCAAW